MAVLSLLAAALAGTTATTAEAQTAVTWTYNGSGNWNATANWTGLLGGDLFPNNGANTYTVTIPGVTGQAFVRQVTFDVGTGAPGNTITLSGLTLSPALGGGGSPVARLVVGTGVTLNTGTFGNLSAGTLSGGEYVIQGTLKFNDPNPIVTVASGTSLVLSGPSAQILKQDGGLGLNFTTNNGIIEFRDGALFARSVNLVNTGTIYANNGSTFTYSNATLTNTGGFLTASGTTSNGGVVDIRSARIDGGTLFTAGTGRITFSNSGGNVLNGVTLAGHADLALTSAPSQMWVENGLTLSNATIDINGTSAGSSIVGFRGTQTLGGTGTVVFGNTNGAANYVWLDNNDAVLTIGPNVTIRGQNGTIGIGNGSNRVVVNNGHIAADVAGGTITLQSASFTNNGALEAKNGGMLNLATLVNNGPSGALNASNNGVIRMNGATVTGGTINTTSGGRFTATYHGGNILSDVTINGALDLATTQGMVRVNGTTGLTLTAGSTANINNGSILQFEGNRRLEGAGAVVFGDFGASNYVWLDGNNATLTIGANATIRGQNGTIGIGNGSNRVVVNNGHITADVTGGTITLQSASFTNNGALEAKNGGLLSLATTVNNDATGAMNVSDNGVIRMDGATVTGGTINTTSGGRFTAAYHGGNVLNDVTVNGALDLATSQSQIRVNGATGLTLAAGSTANVNSNSTLQFEGNQTLGGAGAIVFGNTGSGNTVRLEGNNTTLTVGTNAAIRGHSGTIGLGNGADRIVINNGRIAADVADGTISLQSATFTNNGALEAKNGGLLSLATTVNNGPTGTMNVSDNGVIRMNGATVTGGTINTTGGGRFTAAYHGGNVLNDVTVNGALDLATSQSQIRVNGATGLTLTAGSTANVNSNSTLQFEGNQTLGGAGAIVFGNTGSGNTVRLEGNNTTLTIGTNAAIRGQNGTIGIGNGADRSLINNGTIASDAGGLITVSPINVTNNGTLRAQNGTLTLNSAVTGTGKLQVDAAGVLNMSNTGPTTQAHLAMGAAGATLNTNNQNITITKDYTNVAAGSGNSFNRRAGVNGTGQILAGGDAAQAITGAAVTNGATNNATLTIGNVRVGTSTHNYQIANTGTNGADLRGAIQTAVNGGNITDARLSGAGVTAGNYGPVAVGTNSGNMAVNFTANTAGVLAPMSGQAVNLQSNFQNIADQKLNIVLASGAAAYNMAEGSTAATVNLGNTRVGGTLAGNIAVANTAPTGTFTEKLSATFGNATGNAAHNGGSVSLLTAGTSNNSAMGVSLNTSAAGARTGTVAVNYATDGTGTSGLAAESVGSQTVTVNGNVYQAAQGQLNSTPLNFGTVQVGQSVSKVLSITNSATGPAGFVEDLNVSFGSATGTGSSLINGSGSISGLQAGATNNSAMKVSVNTSAAGSVAGNIAVNYYSAGAVNGVSNGLGTLAVGSSQFGVNGNIQAVANVVDQALPVVNTASVNLGNVRQNATSPTAFVSVTNQATGNQQAALNATITGNGPVTAGGAFNLLAPGATNAGALQVGMNTGTAGAVNGTATIGFVSDASNIGGCAPNCQLALASQNVNVSGAVYRLANPSVNSAPVNLVARVGDVAPTASIGVTNVSPDVYTERLNASFGGVTPVGFTTSGAITGLAAQATSNALQVALNTGTAGAFGGNAVVNLVSSGAGTTMAADETLASGSVALNGKVYAAAKGELNTNTVNFGIVHVGDAVAARNVSVKNGAAVAGLNDVLTGDITGGGGAFTVGGTLGSGVTAGNTNASSLTVGLNTSTAGSYTGSAAVNFRSHNDDMTDLALGSETVTFEGVVNNYANAAFTKTGGAGLLSFLNNGFVLDFGSVQQGTTPLSTLLGVKNAVTGPADELNGAFDPLGLSVFAFSGFDAFSGLGAGLTFDGLGVLFDTNTLGSFSHTITLAWFGSNASGYQDELSNLQLTIRGTVTAMPPISEVPEPSTVVLLAIGLCVLGWKWKRSRAATTNTL
ncbi:choice-of-anchor D domain-containing protein [Gemmatimonas aurantiaca]|uniref:beta strand repeat-containing protein n=1 Tax=Gemmatimonas aurantiaca TaxID=173480 RepID=UPI00301D19C2